jgi:hypothetical protein
MFERKHNIIRNILMKIIFMHIQDGADAVQQQSMAGMQTESTAAAQPSSSGAASNSARKSSEPPAQVRTRATDAS